MKALVKAPKSSPTKLDEAQTRSRTGRLGALIRWKNVRAGHDQRKAWLGYTRDKSGRFIRKTELRVVDAEVDVVESESTEQARRDPHRQFLELLDRFGECNDRAVAEMLHRLSGNKIKRFTPQDLTSVMAQSIKALELLAKFIEIRKRVGSGNQNDYAGFNKWLLENAHNYLLTLPLTPEWRAKMVEVMSRPSPHEVLRGAKALPPAPEEQRAISG